jgi:hypothetical protein
LTAFSFCIMNSAVKPSEEDDSIKAMDMAEFICKSL